MESNRTDATASYNSLEQLSGVISTRLHLGAVVSRFGWADHPTDLLALCTVDLMVDLQLGLPPLSLQPTPLPPGLMDVIIIPGHIWSHSDCLRPERGALVHEATQSGLIYSERQRVTYYQADTAEARTAGYHDADRRHKCACSCVSTSASSAEVDCADAAWPGWPDGRTARGRTSQCRRLFVVCEALVSIRSRVWPARWVEPTTCWVRFFPSCRSACAVCHPPSCPPSRCWSPQLTEEELLRGTASPAGIQNHPERHWWRHLEDGRSPPRRLSLSHWWRARWWTQKWRVARTSSAWPPGLTCKADQHRHPSFSWDSHYHSWLVA